MPRVGKTNGRVEVDDAGFAVGISLLDLDRQLVGVVEKLRPALDLRREAIVKVGDDACVPFRSNVDVTLAASICDRIRSDDRAMGDTETRCYVRIDDEWQKVKSETTLTVIVDGQTLLDPRVFPPEPLVEVDAPAQRSRIY